MNSSTNDQPLIESAESKKFHPLWDRYKRIVSREPQPVDSAEHWRWADLKPLLERSVREVSMEEAERRVLMYANPAHGPGAPATSSLAGAVQALAPGERAAPHRHTAAALRFVLDPGGGDTVVEGRRCTMHPGDLILTPSWCWHGHENSTDHTVYWFDGIDIPLTRAQLDVHFFDPGAAAPKLDEAEDDDRVWSSLEAAGAWKYWKHPYSPRFRYPWQDAMNALNGMLAESDGSKRYDYAHPATGGAVMPTIDCHLLRLESGKPTLPARSTATGIVVVAEGSGESVIGDRRISWTKNDVFSIPHWRWFRHRANGARAHLFFMSDREALRRLDLLREEKSEDEGTLPI